MNRLMGTSKNSFLLQTAKIAPYFVGEAKQVLAVALLRPRPFCLTALSNTISFVFAKKAVFGSALIRIPALLLLMGICFPVYLSASENMAHNAISVDDCRVRLIPMKVPRAAGYMRLINHSSTDRTLVLIETDRAGKVEIHQSLIQNGIAKMKKLKDLTVPANGSVKMKSGGIHLMFTKIDPALKFGDTITLRLRFKNGEVMAVDAKVISVMQDVKTHRGHK